MWRFESIKNLIKVTAILNLGDYWPFLLTFLPPIVAFDCWTGSRHSSRRSSHKLFYGEASLTFFWRTLAGLGKSKKQLKPGLIYGSKVGAYFFKFLVNFTETYFFPKVCFNFLPYKAQAEELKGIFKAVENCVYPKLRTFHRLFFVKDFISLMAISFHQKNANLFLRWVVKFMERISPRLHRKFLSFFKLFLVRLYTRNYPSVTHKGFKLTVKGKISVTGNAKKRTQRITCGAYSLSKKSHKISYAKSVVHTPTGVLGLKCFIFY